MILPSVCNATAQITCSCGLAMTQTNTNTDGLTVLWQEIHHNIEPLGNVRKWITSWTGCTGNKEVFAKPTREVLLNCTLNGRGSFTLALYTALIPARSSMAEPGQTLWRGRQLTSIPFPLSVCVLCRFYNTLSIIALITMWSSQHPKKEKLKILATVLYSL